MLGIVLYRPREPEGSTQDAANLAKLRSFVQSEFPVAGDVITSTFGGGLQGTLRLTTLTRIGGLELCDDANTQRSTSFYFGATDALLLALQAMATCPTLTDLNLRLPNLNFNDLVNSFSFIASSSNLVLQVFSDLRTSHSLSTLDVTFNADVPKHVEAIARCFSGNSVLRSCTLRLHPCDRRCHPLRTVLAPFTTTVQSGANLGLKELVLIFLALGKGCGVCQKAIANLVACNATLERLEVGSRLVSVHSKDMDGEGVLQIARPVGCNRTLKEIRIPCSIPELKELVLSLVPDADGRQANTSLSTLTVDLAYDDRSVLGCMTDLANLVDLNTTLKHVQVCQEGWRPPGCWVGWKGRSMRNEGEKVRVSKLRGELEWMLNNELRRNTCLQSLTVGLWKLLRVGDGHEWQMTYEGSCLEPRERYEIKLGLC